MYLVKTPKFIQNLFPALTWSIPSKDKVMYLTFDDGPIPDITPWVLDTLKQYDAKGTFFCVGENAAEHTAILDEVISQGHAVGNHTHQHLNGWATENSPYLHNVRKCAKLIPSNLFRPPYGRISRKQAQSLQRHYRVVMWDVLSGDFDHSISPQQCLANVINKAGPGSIVVFHDSVKAAKNLKYALPRVLRYFSEQGYRFEALEQATDLAAMPKAS